MGWFDVNKKLPDRVGDIIVLIDGCRFFGKVVSMEPLFMSLREQPSIQFQLPIMLASELTRKGRWRLPTAFKDPTHWLYTPPLPEM